MVVGANSVTDSMVYLRINRRRTTRFVKCALWITICITAIFLLLFPLIFRSFISVQRYFIFENDGARDRFFSFNNTEQYDLVGAYNYRIPSTEVGIFLGVWQILPFSLISLIPTGDSKAKEEWFLKQLKDEKPVVLYCHGNKPSRATPHRVMLYEVLQNMNFHVITFDYRGYGDSTAVPPTEDGVVQDALALVNWIRVHSKSSLYIWGHSLGSGIAAKTSRILCESSRCPDALILQAPFTSLEDELKIARATIPFRFLPWFDYMFISPLRSQGLVFDTKENILFVDSPLLILHAEDDTVVPYELGRKLFQIAYENRKTKSTRPNVKFASFDRKFKYGHNYICKAPELPVIIREFLKETTSRLAV